eukprot:3236270-Amphidinium_carterae.1
MSFGGWTTARVAEMKVDDPRIKCALMQCPSLVRGELQGGIAIPVMLMTGVEEMCDKLMPVK